MSWGEPLRARVRYHPAVVRLRALRRAGLRGWLVDGALARAILHTAPVSTEPAEGPAPVEVHLLCHRHDHLIAIWALKTFYHFAATRLPLVLHLQGRFPAALHARMRAHFPGARIVGQAEADACVEQTLRRRGLPRLLALRGANPLLLKVTDFALLGAAERVLALDSDVLFFAPPAELMEAVGRGGPGSLFQRDVGNGYTVTPEWARERLGIRLAPGLNSGIALFPRDPAELDRCERYLAHPELLHPSGLVEQTLHALSACERGPVAHLSPRYLVRLDAGGGYDGVVARHYAGPSRRWIGGGMRHLRAGGLLRRLAG